jgi:D-beta-D-heptose 7-phosphate kinase/D-beta-D-heptose 1-phosphate adenosyltransferase
MSDLASAIASVDGVVAVVVGDLMLDEYVWGQVSRISPEAPVPIVAVEGRSHVPGGAANVSTGIVALGGTARLGGVVGDDDAGRRLLAALAERRIDCEGVLVADKRTTTTKTRVIAHNQQVVRTDYEQKHGLDADLEDRIATTAAAQLEQADVLVLSDYAKGVLSPALTQRLIAAARSRPIPIVVDPKGVDYEKYRGATVLTPNVHDAERAANYRVEGDEDLREVAQRLEAAVPDAFLLVTRGAEGMSLLRGEVVAEVAADARDVYDVTGAGDTVVSTLAVALGAGIDIVDAVRLANAAAGIVVGKVGTSTVSTDELRARLASTSSE